MQTTSFETASVRHNEDWSGECEVRWINDRGQGCIAVMPARDFLALALAVGADVIRERMVKAIEDAMEGLV